MAPSSLLVSVLRGPRGLIAGGVGARPAERLELYEFESCPFCRKVRETLSELDLEYVSRTSARGSAKRPLLKARGGREMFPYLVDPNLGRELYESEEIIDHLHEHYGRGRSAIFRMLSPLNTFGAAVASLARPRGGKVRRARPEQPAQLLELYNFEASPYCRKVRETLNELDLDYLVKSVAKRSARRAELVARGGKMMVPFLVDPSSGVAMYESEDIIAYLEASYG